MKVPFTKMHGLGNDFVIIDGRKHPYDFNASAIQQLCHRRYGIGADQFILLCPPHHPEAHVRMRIFNPDGGEVETCGNASRCVAWLLATQGIPHGVLETIPGLLRAQTPTSQEVQMSMGKASFHWETIPLSKPLSSSSLQTTFQTLVDPVAVNVGNPHMVFFVEDLSCVDMETLGRSLSTHSLFPQGTNIEVVRIIDFYTLDVRVYERGAGITPACGSGACAAAAAAVKQGLAHREVTVHLEGGSLKIHVLPSQEVLMTGPVALNFEGTFDSAWLP